MSDFTFSTDERYDEIIKVHTGSFNNLDGIIFNSAIVNPSPTMYSYVRAFFRLDGNPIWTPAFILLNGSSYSFTTDCRAEYIGTTNTINVYGGKSGAKTFVKVIELIANNCRPIISSNNKPQDLATIFDTDKKYDKVLLTGSIIVPSGSGLFTTTINHGLSYQPYVEAWVVDPFGSSVIVSPWGTFASSYMPVRPNSTSVTFNIYKNATYARTIEYRIYSNE